MTLLKYFTAKRMPSSYVLMHVDDWCGRVFVPHILAAAFVHGNPREMQPLTKIRQLVPTKLTYNIMLQHR